MDAKSFVKYVVTSDTTTFPITFPYFDVRDIEVNLPTDRAGGTWSINTTTQQVMLTGPVHSGTVLIRRRTSPQVRHIFAALMRFNFKAVDENFLQASYWMREALDDLEIRGYLGTGGGSGGGVAQDQLDALNQKILTEQQAREKAILDEQAARTTAIAAEGAERNKAIAAQAALDAAALLAKANELGTAVKTEETRATTAESSLGSRIDTVTSATAANAAAIQTETTARTTAISAETTARQELAAKVDALGVVGDTSATAEKLATMESTINTAVTNANAASTKAETFAAKIDANTAAIDAETTARSTADTALGSRIDTVSAATGANAAAITAETQARTTAVDALASQITNLSAGKDLGFDAAQSWQFENDGNAEGWTASLASAVLTVGHGVLKVVNSDASGTITRTIDIKGEQNPVVRARVRRIAGSGWQGSLVYLVSGSSAEHTKSIAQPAEIYQLNSYALLEWDLSADTDWTGSQISTIRLFLGNTATDAFDIDWIAIGKRAPGAGTAALTEEANTRATADTALSQKIDTVQARLDTGGDVKTALVQVTQKATATAEAIEGSWTLLTDVNGKVSGMRSVNDGTTSTFKVDADVSSFGDFSNLCLNGSGVKGISGWEGVPAAMTSWSWTDYVGYKTALHLVAAASYYGAQFDVSSGDTFYVKMLTMPSGTGTGQYPLGIGFELQNSRTGAKLNVIGGTRGGGLGGQRWVEGTITIPAGYDKARMLLSISKSGTTVGEEQGGNYYVAGVTFTRAVSNKMFVGLLDAQKIQVYDLSALTTHTGSLILDNWMTISGGTSEPFGGIRTAGKGYAMDNINGIAMYQHHETKNIGFEVKTGSNLLRLVYDKARDSSDCMINFHDKFVVDNDGNVTAQGNIEASSLKANTLMVKTEHLAADAASVSRSASFANQGGGSYTPSSGVRQEVMRLSIPATGMNKSDVHFDVTAQGSWSTPPSFIITNSAGTVLYQFTPLSFAKLPTGDPLPNGYVGSCSFTAGASGTFIVYIQDTSGTASTTMYCKINSSTLLVTNTR